MDTKKHGFTLIREEYIEEFRTTAKLFEHDGTKAQLLSLTNDDENKSFGITFRTPPTDSTGIAHILEHSVLCGSKKYPLKEPFIELVKGSLNTFLNAFTYPDKTSYPVASTNEKDFYNLVDVYLDAVFFPLLSPETLKQEGWHLHQEKKDDTPTFRGIVYNEMKGAYSSPDRALWDTIQASLLPDTPYRYDSGGDPLEIPHLTYENFKKFHGTYYHPSNSLIFFSGNDSEEKRLTLTASYLDQFSYTTIDAAIPVQRPFLKPVRVHAPVVISAEEDPAKKGMTSVNWVWSKTTDRKLSLRLRTLSFILSGTPASPLRRALIESKLGEDIAAGGVEGDLAQLVYAIGLRGMNTLHADKVEQIIDETLRKLVREGIEKDQIDAALNTIEFSLREQNTGSFPRGLSILYGILPSWQHGGDPFEALHFQQNLAVLKADLNAGKRVFEELISTYMLNNPHRSTVILDPDASEQKRRDEKEATEAAAFYAHLSTAEKDALVSNTTDLMHAQTKADPPEKLNMLPKLHPRDLEQKNARIPTEYRDRNGIEILSHALSTNGITYLDLAFDCHSLPARLIPYLPLFARTLIEMGTTSEPFDVFVHRVNKKSGGVWTQLFCSAHKDKPESVLKLMLRAKFLPSQVNDVRAILTDCVLHANLANKERFTQLLSEEKSDLELEIVESGHQFADSRIRQHYRETDWVDEQVSGLEQMEFIRSLMQKVEGNWSEVQQDLEELRNKILTSHGLTVNITADDTLLPSIHTAVDSFLQSLPQTKHNPVRWEWKNEPQSELLIVPTSVNYVGQGTNLYDAGYVLDGSAIVVARYLRSSWLWEQVRMKGGAYGAFSAFDTLSGSFTFLSYRDPHIEETLSAFAGAAHYLQTLHVSDHELEKAIIGTISDFDHYMLPDSRGFASLTRDLVGLTEERRQTLRDQILSTTKEDFGAFGKVLEHVTTGPVVVVTSKKNALRDLQPVVHSVL